MRSLLPIVVLVCVLGGGLSFVNAQSVLPWTWSYIPTTPYATTTVVVNDDYYEFSISNITLTGPGFKLGSPYLQVGKYPVNQTPWSIDYHVISATASTTCVMRPFQSTTAIPGSTAVNLVAGSRTTTSLPFTNSFINSGETNVAFYRSSGTCTMVIRVYSIKDAFGNDLWTPAIQNNSEIIFPSDIDFQSDTIAWSLGYMILLMSIQTWFVIIRRR